MFHRTTALPLDTSKRILKDGSVRKLLNLMSMTSLHRLKIRTVFHQALNIFSDVRPNTQNTEYKMHAAHHQLVHRMHCMRSEPSPYGRRLGTHDTTFRTSCEGRPNLAEISDRRKASEFGRRCITLLACSRCLCVSSPKIHAIITHPQFTISSCNPHAPFRSKLLKVAHRCAGTHPRGFCRSEGASQTLPFRGRVPIGVYRILLIV